MNDWLLEIRKVIYTTNTIELINGMSDRLPEHHQFLGNASFVLVQFCMPSHATGGLDSLRIQMRMFLTQIFRQSAG